jgi:hypothetical protein
MSGKAFTRLFVTLFLVLGMAAVAIAGPKKQGIEAPGAAAQTGKSDSDTQKGKKLTPSESHQPVDP